MDNRISNLLDLRYNLTKDLYRQAAQANAAKASGVESLVYSVFGTSLMSSIALALDPFWQFPRSDLVKKAYPALIGTVFPQVVTSANRTRKFTVLSKGSLTEFGFRDVYNWSSGADYVGPPSFWRQYYDRPGTNQHFTNVTVLFAQSPLYGWINDTTIKSRTGSRSRRDINSLEYGQGECEMFIPKFTSTRIKVAGLKSKTDYKWKAAQGDGTLYNGSKQIEFIHSRFDGPDAGVDITSIPSITSELQTKSLAAFQKHLPSMFSRCLPSRRNFQTMRELAELKDVPQMVRGTTRLWRDIEKAAGISLFRTLQKGDLRYWNWNNVKHLRPYFKRVGVNISPDQKAADNYLNFKFGWLPYLSTVRSLLSKPERWTRSVNYLIDRNGKDTTLSTSKHVDLGLATSPSFYVPKSVWETDLGSGTITRPVTSTCVIRCVVNSGINFPRLELPRLRTETYRTSVGLYPSPADIYDLIPWSWLVDWFSGLGDYVHILSEVGQSSSQSPINYGFMTAHVRARYGADRELYRDATFSTGDPTPVSSPHVVSWVERYRRCGSAQLDLKYYLRRSIENVLAKPLYNGSNLSLTQSTILGALFLKYLG